MLENKKARLIVVSHDSAISPASPVKRLIFRDACTAEGAGFIRIRDVDVVRAGGSLAVNLGKVRFEDHPAKYDAEIAARSEGVHEPDRGEYTEQKARIPDIS